MERLKHHWFRIPATVRKPFVLVIGLALVIISPFTGVLPGPGGIPIFLLGVAILSTEFEWAQRLRDWTLAKVHWLSQLWKQHKVVGTILFALFMAAAIGLSLLFYRWMRTLLS
ncbi:MAG TPA: PGPGW domain-containing protein [Candidatus Saccharimonadales bacterium]|nr:PGPGW domain-containing protein [Candidatus Saccharimonadales bacterium]